MIVCATVSTVDASGDVFASTFDGYLIGVSNHEITARSFILW